MFRNDYSELAHPQVLKALSTAGYTQLDGYGNDKHTKKTIEILRKKIGNPTAEIHFIAGGTHANLVTMSSMLRQHEAIISCESGHISVDEAGALEATGHKICTMKGENGKLRIEDIASVVNTLTSEHQVRPRVVYITQPTELGSVYKKAELAQISEYCRKNDLYLFIDGARLGSGLNSPVCDMTYCDVAELVDAFYIGGTKNGALYGEAIVICKDELKPYFRHSLKQKGALLAKGASIALQFEALFADGLYDQLARHANDAAQKLTKGIMGLGYGFYSDVETNQVFPIFPAEVTKRMQELYSFRLWHQDGDDTVVRLVTSWATLDDMVDEFIKDLAEIKAGL